MDIKISRNQQLLNKVVIIDGFPGCGKTMLSPIVSAFDRVEIMQYAPVIEQVCELWGLSRIDDDVADAMVKMNADFLIYNVMMGRNTNCRPTDLSSIFQHNPIEHIKRMLGEGDKAVPELINQQKPILHLTTHMLLPNSKPLFRSLGDKLTFIEVVRHPLYMVIQQEKNFKMIEGARHQHIRYTLKDKEYSFFCKGWESTFDNSNSFEKAIYSIDWYYSKLESLSEQNCLIIPFEIFVKDPDDFMTKISSSLSSEISDAVTSEMEKQKVPRKQLSDGPALDIYKRCGWTPPQFSLEEEELEVRRELVAKNVSKEVLALTDKISERYVAKYLSANKDLD